MNNDDMDDAFKKAAEDYELNEELAADWKGVHKALQPGQPQAITEVKKEKRRRFIFFWWLLLVPAAWLIAYETGVFSPGFVKKNNTADAGVSTQPLKSALKDDVKKIRDGNDKNDSLSIMRLKSSIQTVHQQKSLPNNFAKQNLTYNNDIKTDINSKNKTGNLPDAANTITNNEATEVKGKAEIIAFDENKNVQQNYQQKNTENDSGKTAMAAVNQQQENKLPVNNSTLNPSLSAKKKTADNYVRQAYKYAGITANADLSFIKNQKTSGIGFGAGVIAGYHFKNGISIETGLQYDKKNYYTQGKYFSKEKLDDYLKYSTIITSDGNCNMWEIPLNVRYDFNTRRKYNWFVTTGISSYFMNKEYYYFTYEKDGDLRHHGYDYKHSSKDWFSVLNIGGGVNIKAGDKYLLQLQPYYKMPLSGVGIGSLSLSSTGMNVNLVRRIK